MSALAAPFLKGAALKNRAGEDKYALQNKDTAVRLPETFEVSRALQMKIHVGCGKEEGAADLLPAAWVLAVRPSRGLETAFRARLSFALDDAAHFSSLGGRLETRGRTFGDDELVLG
jgi:hypothetical protein